jgi:hypothetical protein
MTNDIDVAFIGRRKGSAMTNRILFASITVFLGFLLLFSGIAKGQTPTTATVAVELDLAKFAAIHYAKQFYGKMEFYKAFTYYDAETEQPDVYAIVLKNANAEAPDLEMLQQKIDSGQKKIDTLETRMEEVQGLELSGKKKAERRAELRAEILAIRKEMAGTARFATFLCGATEDHVPVIRAHRGLPEHMLALPRVKALVVSDPELQGKKIGRILYLGMFDQVYVLQVPDFEKRVQKVDGGSRAASNGYAAFIRSSRVQRLSTLRNEIAHRRAKAQEAQTLTAKGDEKDNSAQRKEERRQIIKNKWKKVKNAFAREGRR